MRIRQWLRLTVLHGLIALVSWASAASAGTVILAETSPGLQWQPTETGFADYVELVTSGGPSGAADATLVLEVTAPAGKLFSFDPTGYAAESAVNFWFRPIIGFSSFAAGVTFTNPTFGLVGASGVSLGSPLTQSVSDPIANTVSLITEYPLNGMGTFSGFRMTVGLTNFGSQTITFGGGDAYAANATTLSTIDPTAVGPVLSLVNPVPEPSTYALALAGLACGGSVVWRRRKLA